MQKLSRSNLKFIRTLRHLRDHAGLNLQQAVKVSVMGSCQVYLHVDLGPQYLRLTKDLGNVDQLSLVMEKLGL
jgi:hypothetical protein